MILKPSCIIYPWPTSLARLFESMSQAMWWLNSPVKKAVLA